jgi:hypothetical protein
MQLTNSVEIILGKLTPYFEKIMGDYQNGFRYGRSVTDNISALKIMRKFAIVIRGYNIYSLISKRHITRCIETRYATVWKNLKFLQN